MAGVEPAFKNTSIFAPTRIFLVFDFTLPRPKGNGDASAISKEFQIDSLLRAFYPIPICDSGFAPTGGAAGPRVALIKQPLLQVQHLFFTDFLTSALRL